MKRFTSIAAFFVFSLLLLSSIAPAVTHADSLEDIRDQIAEINRERAKIDEEIAGYQKQLQSIGAEKQTLQSSIQTLDVSRSQTQAQITSIQKKINAANLRLNELSLEIQDTEGVIALDRDTLGESLRTMQAVGDSTLIEQLFSADGLADAWVAADNLGALNDALRAHTAALTEAKEALAAQHESVAGTKVDLSKSNVDLQSQKQALDLNRQGKQQLLTQTQQSEAQYQSLIAEKKAQQAAFESKLFTFEAQLKQALDPGSFAAAGKGVLAYPIANPRITQYFGATVDAKRLYVSGSHGGVDFGAPVGTPITAALTGTVTAIETTRIRSGCQYGKFVLLKHDNGLSTIYGHLSQVSVEPGDSVKTGDVIGYSGATGYATGPHLHFGVYATEGIKLVTADQLGSTYCAGIPTVAANPDAYLDPMDYL